MGRRRGLMTADKLYVVDNDDDNDDAGADDGGTPVNVNAKGAARACCTAWRCLALLPLVVAAAFGGVDAWVKRKSYAFTRAEVEAAALAALRTTASNSSCEALMVAAVEQLRAARPELQLPRYEDAEWIWIAAGGWLGAFKLLYASATEYVLLFGTAIPTSGHSGRYLIDVEDTLLCGTFAQWKEGVVAPAHYRPGDPVIVHAAYEATGVAWSGETWMLEHGVGHLLATTLPFAFGGTSLVAQDAYAVYRSLVVYGRHVLLNALQGRF